MNLRKVMYSCKYASLLIEKREQGKITFKERLQLTFHLLGCSICRLYSRQSVLIDRAVQKLYQESKPSAAKLDEGMRKDLQVRIEGELNKN